MGKEFGRIKKKIKADLAKHSRGTKSFFNGASKEEMEKMSQQGVSVKDGYQSQGATENNENS